MENPLVIGILNIVEDKLREFGIQIPDDDREDSTDPIVGYQYAELHDRIQEYLETAGITVPHKHDDLDQKNDMVQQVSEEIIGTKVEYGGYFCEVIHVEGNTVCLQEMSSDLHMKISAFAYLNYAYPIPSEEEKKPSLSEQIHSAAARVSEAHASDNSLLKESPTER